MIYRSIALGGFSNCVKKKVAEKSGVGPKHFPTAGEVLSQCPLLKNLA